jgi:hypothetical protein
MMFKRTRWPLLVLAVAAVAVLLPASGNSRVPEDDGSTYSWAGAATLTVDVKPWGGGYVRSDPYLIDCPLACVRSFDQNREVKLTALARSRLRATRRSITDVDRARYLG